MTLKYFEGHFSLGCHFHVDFSNSWHAIASHGLPAIAELLVVNSDNVIKTSEIIFTEEVKAFIKILYLIIGMDHCVESYETVPCKTKNVWIGQPYNEAAFLNK